MITQLITLRRRFPPNGVLPPGTDVLIGNTLLVSDLGTAGGIRENWTRHFNTIDLAYAAAVAGDTIIIAPGVYTTANNLFKEGVSYKTLGGDVEIQYTGGSYLFDFTGIAASLSIEGDFWFNSTSGGIFNINGLANPLVLHFRVAQSTGIVLNVVTGPHQDLLYVNGKMQGDGSSVTVNVAGDMQFEIIGDIINLDNSALTCNGNLLRLNVFGNIINETSDVGLSTVWIETVRSLNVFGDVINNAGFLTHCLLVIGNGGDIHIAGTCSGCVRSESTGTNGVFENQIKLNHVFGFVENAGREQAIVIYGTLSGYIESLEATAVTIMNGVFSGLNWHWFSCEQGRIIINGTSNRAITQYPCFISGGEVVINASLSADLGMYLSSRGLIRCAGGTLRLSGSLTNVNTGPSSAIVDFESGNLILHGVSLHTDGIANNAKCILCNTSLSALVYGCVENADDLTDQEQIFEFAVGAVTVGDTYRITIDGNICDHIAVGGDTPTIIATDLATQIDALANVSAANVAGVITVTADVAGVPFTYATGGAGPGFGPITTTPIAHNHDALGNLISGTNIIVDVDVL